MNTINILNTGAWDYNTNSHEEAGYFDPSLTNWLLSFLTEKGVKNLFDFGCSTGYYLQYLSEKSDGLNLLGVEPNVSLRENRFHNILQYDLAKPFNLNQTGTILCLEVLEHIPPAFESIVIDNIVNHCDKYLIISWAVPGQGGYGHFNEKSFDDVQKLFKNRGFSLMSEETRIARDNAQIPWLKNNVAVFIKES